MIRRSPAAQRGQVRWARVPNKSHPRTREPQVHPVVLIADHGNGHWLCAMLDTYKDKYDGKVLCRPSRELCASTGLDPTSVFLVQNPYQVHVDNLLGLLKKDAATFSDTEMDQLESQFLPRRPQQAEHGARQHIDILPITPPTIGTGE